MEKRNRRRDPDEGERDMGGVGDRRQTLMFPSPPFFVLRSLTGCATDFFRGTLVALMRRSCGKLTFGSLMYAVVSEFLLRRLSE